MLKEEKRWYEKLSRWNKITIIAICQHYSFAIATFTCIKERQAERS